MAGIFRVVSYKLTKKISQADHVSKKNAKFVNLYAARTFGPSQNILTAIRQKNY